VAAPKLCLDTNVLIAFLKGRDPGASAVEQAIRGYECYVTAITVYELLFGVARAEKHIGENDLLSMMHVVPLDDAAARKAAHLHVTLLKRNQDIGVKDVLLAAICLETSLPLLTLNERHFSRVEGLDVIAPESLLA
jgi:predicted nucleic acid-binding protein